MKQTAKKGILGEKETENDARRKDRRKGRTIGTERQKEKGTSREK
jgi:hypothetical protein